jgi:hypothetical protein
MWSQMSGKMSFLSDSKKGTLQEVFSTTNSRDKGSGLCF